VEDHKALENRAVVRELADAIQHEVENLFADGVVTTGVVIGSILLAGDELLRMVQLAVSASTNLVTDTRLKVDEDGTGNVFSRTSLGEKVVKGVVTATDSLV
jgi:hypothetical protein